MIEQAQFDDAREMLRVINTSNRELYQGIIPKEHFREPFMAHDKLLKSFGEMTFYVHRGEDEIQGVVALQSGEGGIGWLSRLYVLPEYQRRGIGSALVGHVEREAAVMKLKKLRLRVAERAEWAVEFYRKLGYESIDRMERSEGFVVVMEKQLGSG